MNFATRVAGLAALAFATAASAGEQVAIKYEASAGEEQVVGQRLRSAAGADLRVVRPMSGNAWVIALPDNITEQERDRILAALRTVPGVQWIESEVRHYTNTLNGGWVPNDPNFGSSQWNLHDPAITGNAKAAVNAVNAWAKAKGDGMVIAIVDNGVNSTHPDLQGKLLQGYNFITRTGRGTNTQSPAFGARCANAAQQNGSAPTMSYHGTTMAGIAAAATNNSVGVAGVAPNASILPIKVLDECTSSSFDVADGIRWAAGLSVPGVPVNSHPARVINISLSSPGSCDQVTQSAIQDAVGAGSVVVTIAGNDGGAVGNTGSCNGAITVGAVDYAGARASYSNYGSQVALMAPGGGGVITQADPVYGWSLGSIGATSYDNNGTPIYNANGSGTSNAAPQVAGVAALMLGVRPALTPAAVRQLLQKSARPFVDASCNSAICGAGMLDALAAVNLAESASIPTAVASAPSSVTTGTSVALDGSRSTSGNASYAWKQLSGPTVTLNGADTAIASFTPTAAGDYQFGLTVADRETGLSAGTSVLLSATAAATSSASTGSSGGGGGGGAFGPLEAAMLFMAGALAFAGRRRAR